MTHDHTHDDEHGEHGEDAHDAATHSDRPLTGVDLTPLHAAVDELAATLRTYVETAVGVRAEFGAHESDEDPRILSLEAHVGTLNAALYDALHTHLGMHADLTGMTWGGEEHDDDGADEPSQVDSFHLGVVVGLTPAAADRTLDSALDVLEAAGADVAQSLVEAGFVVTEWGVARGSAVEFDWDGHEEDES
ncbi:hypothetical protein [Cellulomonas composti]|uniref:Uncharacterized protein n=1 Tax=Cellulomonas composti TaxID=266130 RepID=A0A511JCE1_9CELL|nr:hypothetical protein [Cellulomonas composti]GEL95644.1 hypothetical protein CCO02nite_23020 [Cellulomonas composti]